MTSSHDRESRNGDVPLLRKYWKIASLLVGILVIVGIGNWVGFQAPESPKVEGMKEVSQDINAGSSNYDVVNVRLDPVAKGRNQVAVTFRNKTDSYQVAAMHIQTNVSGAGWGSTYLENLEPQQVKEYTFYYSFRDSINRNTWIRLRFYNPPASSLESIDFENYWLEKKYTGSNLERRKLDDSKPLPVEAELAAAITARFREIQDWVGNGKYEDIWNASTRAYRQDEFHGVKKMCENNWNAFSRRGKQFVSLSPADVVKKDSVYILNATLEKANWQIHFVSEAGQWKVDDIKGYVESKGGEDALAAFEKRQARHFDIYYKKGTPAESDIEKIAGERDSGYEQICEFLGTNPDVRISLIFFEDGETKRKETGHQGNGMAKGTLIVEVYNQEIKLDPFHETTHILASEIGHPPAIFNEGLATYMSKWLKTPSNKDREDNSLSLYEKVRENKAKGDWIPLEELLAFTEIGSDWSKPLVAYPQAGSFVKFLIDTYGREKFLEAYSRLDNSKEEIVFKQNRLNLEQIYGKSLETLSQEWLKAMGLPA